MAEYSKCTYPKPLLKHAKRRVQNTYNDVFVYKTTLLSDATKDVRLQRLSGASMNIPRALQSGL